MIPLWPRCPACGCACSMPHDPTRWLTPRAFAEREGVSRTTVYRWIAAGLLHTSRIDGVLKGRREAERAWARAEP